MSVCYGMKGGGGLPATEREEGVEAVCCRRRRGGLSTEGEGEDRLM